MVVGATKIGPKGGPQCRQIIKTLIVGLFICQGAPPKGATQQKKKSECTIIKEQVQNISLGRSKCNHARTHKHRDKEEELFFFLVHLQGGHTHISRKVRPTQDHPHDRNHIEVASQMPFARRPYSTPTILMFQFAKSPAPK